jgi:hypothetical protein
MKWLLVLIFSFLAVAAQADGRIQIEDFQKNAGGCSCTLMMPPFVNDKVNSEAIFWSELSHDPALMKINGQKQNFKLIKDETKGQNIGIVWFENPNYSIFVNFRVAPTTCPKEKIDIADGCEYIDVYGDIEVTRKTDGIKEVVLGVGHCGC